MFTAQTERIRSQIVDEILAELERWQKLSRYPLDDQLITMLRNISVKGKLFRGCLLVQFYGLNAPALSEEAAAARMRSAVILAAAVELYGTALLIHDDIMDRAVERRGVPTVDQQLLPVARQAGMREPEHFGTSSAICAGDFLFFVASGLVEKASVLAGLKADVSLSTLCARELALLGLAQIEDVRQAASTEHPSKDQIISMYEGKTGRYTGRWPLELAAVLAQLSSEQVAQIGAIGEKLGVLYQLKDDELGLVGDEAAIGKSASSDLREGKKTLYYWQALEILQGEELNIFSSVHGHIDASTQEIEQVKEMLQTSGVIATVSKHIAAAHEEVMTDIQMLDIPPEAKTFLTSVADFIVSRIK